MQKDESKLFDQSRRFKILNHVPQLSSRTNGLYFVNRLYFIGLSAYQKRLCVPPIPRKRIIFLALLCLSPPLVYSYSLSFSRICTYSSSLPLSLLLLVSFSFCFDISLQMAIVSLKKTTCEVESFLSFYFKQRLASFCP